MGSGLTVPTGVAADNGYHAYSQTQEDNVSVTGVTSSRYDLAAGGGGITNPYNCDDSRNPI